MKAKERRHLKENELVHTLAATRDFLEARRKPLTAALLITFLIAVAIGGIWIMRERTQAQANAMLAEAMVVLDAQVIPPANDPEKADAPPPAAMAGTGTYATEQAKLEAAIPKLQAAADAFPETRAGITARYHLAGTYAALGRHEDAVKAYDEVVRRAGNSLYGRVARLGKAEEQARAGQYDAAIAAFQELAGGTDGDMPVDAILMQLGRTQAAAGRTAEAQKTFTTIVDEHPESPYVPEAREQLEQLKG